MKGSLASYGAQFCGVRVHKETGKLRIAMALLNGLRRWRNAFNDAESTDISARGHRLIERCGETALAYGVAV